ncbi:MAG: hypothetical protein SVU32_03435 [Candidatus Nanohaloarchaea archaeon]|nr:hypothetical protein [Candidatus Nanohaloarchaea archaeon]
MDDPAQLDDWDDFREWLEERYDDAAERLEKTYLDDRIRRLEETSLLSELSTSERYEEQARNDAEVIKRFKEQREEAASVEELEALYGEAQNALELTGDSLLSLPSREDLERNAPRTIAKAAAKRVFSSTAGIALEVEYGIVNTLRRSRSLREDGDELEADLMEAAAYSRVPFKVAETSEDRLERLYKERRAELGYREGSLVETVRDIFDL